MFAGVPLFSGTQSKRKTRIWFQIPILTHALKRTQAARKSLARSPALVQLQGDAPRAGGLVKVEARQLGTLRVIWIHDFWEAWFMILSWLHECLL